MDRWPLAAFFSTESRQAASRAAFLPRPPQTWQRSTRSSRRAVSSAAGRLLRARTSDGDRRIRLLRTNNRRVGATCSGRASLMRASRATKICAPRRNSRATRRRTPRHGWRARSPWPFFSETVSFGRGACDFSFRFLVHFSNVHRARHGGVQPAIGLVLGGLSYPLMVTVTDAHTGLHVCDASVTTSDGVSTYDRTTELPYPPTRTRRRRPIFASTIRTSETASRT